MAKFRPHTSNFKSSMDSVIEVNSLEELKRELKDHPNYFGGELVCSQYGLDDRNGWDTWLITEDGAFLGFTDSKLI